jgi:hypothetical protein
MLQRPPAKPSARRAPGHPSTRKAALKAARDRRHRQRRKLGVMTAVIEVDGIGLDWLVHSARCLDARDLDGDLRAVRTAVGRAVSAMIRVSSRSS